MLRIPNSLGPAGPVEKGSTMRMHPVAPAALLAAALFACGGEKPEFETPPVGAEDPIAYFGVEPCTCYEFVSKNGSDPRRVGIAVEAVTDLYNHEDVDEYLIRYRRGGSVYRTDVVRPQAERLLLTRVTGDVTSAEIRISPGVSLLSFLPEPKSERIEEHATVTVGGEEHEVSYAATYVPDTVEASLDGTEKQELQALKIRYGNAEGGELPWQDAAFDRWFVPELGIVQLDVPDDTGFTTYVLDRVRPLDGCEALDPAQPPTDVCGTNR